MVMMKYNQSIHFPMRLYPSIMLSPVAFAYRLPYSKNGYLKRLAAMMNPTNANPKLAPARVLCTKCETPIAVLANRIPGPRVFRKFISRESFTEKILRDRGAQSLDYKTKRLMPFLRSLTLKLINNPLEYSPKRM